MWRISHREMCLLLAVWCIVASPATSASSSEWAPSSPFDDANSVDTYTTAFLNVTYRDPMSNHVTTDRSELGKYGEGFVGAAYGLVVHAEGDHMGCSSPLVASQPTEPWIALIKRGHCNFEVKVDLAYRSNATAVLVYNDHESETLDKMRLSTDANRNISAVFTYKWKGEELARLYENGTKVYLGITIGSQCSKSFSNINRTSVLFVSISFIVLMIISLAWLVFYYVQRFRYIHAKDRLSRRLCSAAKKALSKIPTKAIKAGDKEIQGDAECCAVCIEPYKTSDVLRILPCRHEFHKSCIDPWLLEHRTCPMCKMDILKHYGFIFTGSQESILIEEVRVDSSETLQRRHPALRHQLSGSNSPDNESRSSRASTPDEMTPTLSSERSCRSVTESNSQSPVMEEVPDVGSNKSSLGVPSPGEAEPGRKPGHRKTSSDLQDCQLENCESPDTSPSHQVKKESPGQF